ncbi:Isoleucyl-tRNA synthetase IleS [Mycobacteroides abscessus subsp. abscessus]|nr:Isoleucyl-tRNA synthetase IleS [Mycobacteroides abscessus subsp. abscessus]
MLDRYILAKLAQLRDDLTTSMDDCDVSVACEQLRQFTDALTNWYVRRSRSRFWEEDADAIDTLHTVLETTCRLAAPLLPMTTEVIWRGLTGERSVHLTDWVSESVLPADAALVAAMDEVRKVASTGSSLRKAKKLRVRLPLLKLTVAVPDPKRLEPYTALIADELNVKSVELTDDIAAYGKFELTVNARVAGPRLGKDVQTVIRAVKSGDWAQQADGTVVAAGITLREGEFDSKLVAAEPDSTAALPEGGGLVILDDTVTEELEAEGWARDLIRELQDLRKSTGLEVSDRIEVVLEVPAVHRAWAERHRELISGEILATTLDIAEAGPDTRTPATALGDGVRVSLKKAAG